MATQDYDSWHVLAVTIDCVKCPAASYVKCYFNQYNNNNNNNNQPAPVALLVASRYVLPGYGYRLVWVQGPCWPDH